MVAPSAPGLSTSGDTLTTFDANRVVAPQNLTTLASNYGDQKEHWNGVDCPVNVRLANGLFLFGGVSTGKTLLDNCEIAAAGARVADVPALAAHRRRARSSTAASRARSSRK